VLDIVTSEVALRYTLAIFNIRDLYPMAKPKRRRYDASGRQQRAAESQERMLESAGRLFAARGYAETTVDDIARDAGVAVPTIYAVFGSKRGLLSRLVDRLVSGTPDAPPILRTASAQQVLADRDPRRVLTRFAEHMRQIQERIGPVFHAVKNVARSEPEMAEMFRRMQNNRYKNLLAVARHLDELRALRPDLSVEDAGRTIWQLASPETRHAMETYAGWDGDHYQAWLADTLAAALLR
jgi:AcrR family transcriptional regulator